MADLDDLSAEFLEAHPADAARELDRQPPAAVAGLLRDSPARVVGPVLMEMQPQAAAALLQCFDGERMRLLLGAMSATGATAILRQLSEELRTELLGGLPGAMALACRTLLRFPADSVGARMNPAIPILAESATVAEGLQILRTAAAACDGIMLVDGARHLSGWCPAVALLRAEAPLPLRALAVPMSSVPALTPVASAVEGAGPDGSELIAVLDTSRQPLGAIAARTLFGLLHAPTDADPAFDGTSFEFVAAQYWRVVTGLTEIALGMMMPQRERGQ
jgi:Mg/Co/Ni transporter MgtE